MPVLVNTEGDLRSRSEKVKGRRASSIVQLEEISASWTKIAKAAERQAGKYATKAKQTGHVIGDNDKAPSLENLDIIEGKNATMT